MTELFYIEIDNYIEDAKFEELLFLIEQERRNQILNFRMREDKKISLYSELFLRAKICNELNLINSDICFLRNNYGKPYLKDHLEYFYNISHTQNAFAVAISKKCVGVDIEKIKNIDNSNLNVTK